MRHARLLLLSLFALTLAAVPARAATIVTFGNNATQQFIATDNGDGTTSLDISTTVNITQIFAGGLDPSAVFTFHADSLGDANVSNPPLVTQAFAGSFTITNAANTLTYLEGTFGGALQIGVNGGTNSVFTSNNNLLGPLVLASDLSALTNPESFSLALANLTPPFATNTYLVGGVPHTTIASFTASFSGDADAQLSEVPEPASLLLLGTGLVMGAGRLRKRIGR